MKRPPKLRTPDHTRLNLGQDKYYRPFIDGYIKILQSNLKQVKHVGHNYSYTTYTCGEPHDKRNSNWKPFRLLWDYCERTGYDFFVARDNLSWCFVTSLYRANRTTSGKSIMNTTKVILSPGWKESEFQLWLNFRYHERELSNQINPVFDHCQIISAPREI